MSAQREEHRPGQAAHHRQHEREDEDQDLGEQEQLDVLPEGAHELGQDCPEDLGVEERPLDLRPARRGDDDQPMPPKTTTLLANAIEQPARAEAAEQPRAAAAQQLGRGRRRDPAHAVTPGSCYSRNGTSWPVLIHSSRISWCWPLSLTVGQRLVDAVDERVVQLEHERDVVGLRRAGRTGRRSCPPDPPCRSPRAARRACRTRC